MTKLITTNNAKFNEEKQKKKDEFSIEDPVKRRYCLGN